MVYGDPKFPVKNPAPGLTDCVVNFKVTDILAMTGIFVGSSMYGWFTGKPFRAQQASTAGIIGGMAGFMYAYQNSYGRLMGHLED